jgi:hypothetical protein
MLCIPAETATMMSEAEDPNNSDTRYPEARLLERLSLRLAKTMNMKAASSKASSQLLRQRRNV